MIVGFGIRSFGKVDLLIGWELAMFDSFLHDWDTKNGDDTHWETYITTTQPLQAGTE